MRKTTGELVSLQTATHTDRQRELGVLRDLRWLQCLECVCVVVTQGGQRPRKKDRCSSGTQQRDSKQEILRPIGLSHARLRVIKLPVVRNPLSPIAPLHSIDSWPSTARPSRFMSFCSVSSPSFWPSSCSTRNATCKTSRGCRVGGRGSA